VITSPANPRLKLVRRLQSRRQRQRLGIFVVEGEDLVEAGLAAGLDPVDRLVAGLDVEPDVLAGVSELAHPARDLAIFRTADLPASAGRLASVALWQVADPGNVGTLLRSADAFGAGVFLSAGCADPVGSKAARASMGALFRVPVGRFEEAPAPRVALVTRAATPLSELELGERVTFVLGAERRGLPDDVVEACDALATIPFQGAAESLNVAMAGTIALWEWHRRLAT